MRERKLSDPDEWKGKNKSNINSDAVRKGQLFDVNHIITGALLLLCVLAALDLWRQYAINR